MPAMPPGPSYVQHTTHATHSPCNTCVVVAWLVRMPHVGHGVPSIPYQRDTSRGPLTPHAATDSTGVHARGTRLHVCCHTPARCCNASSTCTKCWFTASTVYPLPGASDIHDAHHPLLQVSPLLVVRQHQALQLIPWALCDIHGAAPGSLLLALEPPPFDETHALSQDPMLHLNMRISTRENGTIKTQCTSHREHLGWPHKWPQPSYKARASSSTHHHPLPE